MEVEVVDHGKDFLEVKMDNPTIAEVLRVYLNEQGIKFAAWRREHPTKPVLLKIESSGKTSKKAVSDAISAISKDCDKLLSALKK